MLHAAVPFVHRVAGVMLQVGEVVLQAVEEQWADIRMERGLVVLQGQHVVAAAGAKRRGDMLLAAQRVNGHDGPGHVDELQEFGNGGDLVRRAVQGQLAQGEVVLGGPGTDQVQGALAAGPVAGAAQRLAVDRDAPAGGSGDQGVDPLLEALLKGGPG